MQLLRSQLNPKLPKKFWNWFEASLVGLLALIGVDLIISLVLGVTLGLLDQMGISTEGLRKLLSPGSINGQFIFFTISRLLGLALIISFIRRRKVGLRRFGLKKFPPFRSAGLIAVAMVVLLVSSGLIFYLTQRLWPNADLAQEQEILFTQAANYPQLAMAFIALVIIAPIVEEVIFRGLMLPAFARQFGIVSASVITSILFGLVHWQLNVGIITFIMGLLLSWLYYKTRSLWPAIIFHSLKNLIALLLIVQLP